MGSADLPVAVWSGEIMGVKVYVLDNGQRIIDAEDMNRLFTDTEAQASFDLDAFAVAFKRFMSGDLPNGGADDE